MSILDINKIGKKYNFKKTVIVYLAVSVFTYAVDKIYAVFGHGVSSDAMTWMFLYPLIGGVLFYLLLGLLLPEINRFGGYRIVYNSYNSGITVLTVGSMLKGIMEIAGTNSPYLKLYYITGYAFIVFGFILLVILTANYKKLCMQK